MQSIIASHMRPDHLIFDVPRIQATIFRRKGIFVVRPLLLRYDRCPFRPVSNPITLLFRRARSHVEPSFPWTVLLQIAVQRSLISVNQHSHRTRGYNELQNLQFDTTASFLVNWGHATSLQRYNEYHHQRLGVVFRLFALPRDTHLWIHLTYSVFSF